MGGGFGLETGFVFIVPSTPPFQKRIKQMSEPEKGATLNRRSLGQPDGRANNFVEHPTWHPPSRTIREHYINYIAFSPSTAKNFQLLAE
jgi:hypothetical protein